jgi:hypothetical protein
MFKLEVISAAADEPGSREERYNTVQIEMNGVYFL